ncbi:MAG: hypothetical protein AB1439_06360 [candidate division FCPU426 bacterium]
MKSFVAFLTLAAVTGVFAPSSLTAEEQLTVKINTPPLERPLTETDEWYNRAYHTLWAQPDFWRSLAGRKPHADRVRAPKTPSSPLTVYGDREKNLVWFVWSNRVLGQVRRIEITDIAGDHLATLHPGTRESAAWNFGDRLADIVYFRVWLVRDHQEMPLPPSGVPPGLKSGAPSLRKLIPQSSPRAEARGFLRRD